MKTKSVISRLSRSTKKKLLQFLDSDYFNKDPSLYSLALILSKEENQSLSNKDIWNLLYPKKLSYNDSKLRQLKHKLLEQVKLFFSVEELVKSSSLKIRTLSSSAIRNNLEGLRDDIQRNLVNELTKNSNRIDSTSILDFLTTQKNIISLNSGIAQEKELKSGGLTEKALLSSQLSEIYQQIHYSSYFLLFSNYEYVGNVINPISADKIDWNKVQSEFSYTLPIAELYKNAFSLFTNEGSEIDIAPLIEQLKNFNNVENFEARTIYEFILNFLTRKRNDGIDVDQHLFDLMLFGLESNYELRGGTIEVIPYINIILTACRLKQFDLAHRIADDYKKHLPKEYENSAYNYATSRILMNTRNYSEVVSVLRNVSYDTTGINLNSRLLQIGAFYELEEYEVLVSTIKAFKVFLRRSRKMPKARKQNFIDFCDVVYNLVQATEKSDPKRLDKANSILQNNKAIPNSPWLKEKIAQASDLLGIETS